MKTKFYFFVLFASVLLIASSCNKDKGKGNLNLIMHPKIDGADVAFETTVYSEATQMVRYRVDLLEFYVSNIRLTKKDNSVVSLASADDVKLYYFGDKIVNSSSLNIPSGDYTKITFTLGLGSTLNATAPGDYATDHPMGANSGNYWSMNNSYIFSKLEGFIDTSNTSGATLTSSFVYHVGGDGYTRDITINKEFAIEEDGTTNFPVKLDVLKLWNGSTPVNLKTELQTHTIDNAALATKVLNNYTECFSAE